MTKSSNHSIEQTFSNAFFQVGAEKIYQLLKMAASEEAGLHAFCGELMTYCAENIIISAEKLPSFRNEIYRMIVTDLESGQTYQYCLQMEYPELSADSDARSTIKKESNLSKNFAPILFSGNSGQIRMNLIPYYAQGTLMNACQIRGYLNSEDGFNNYRKAFCLASIREKYLISHKKNKKERRDLKNTSTKEMSYDRFLIARHELSKNERKAEGGRSFGFFKKQHHTLYKDLKASDKKEFMETYFKDLLKDLAEISEAYDTPPKTFESLMADFAPERQFGRSYKKQLKSSIDAITRYIDGETNACIASLPNLEDNLAKQQEIVLNRMLSVFELFTKMEQEGYHYYDLKPENFLIDGDDVVIADNKTLVQLKEWGGGNFFPNGVSHMSYYPPASEGERLQGLPGLDSRTASQLVRYQLGVMLYNMVVGLKTVEGVLPDNASHPYDYAVGRQIDAHLRDDPAFNYPCFKTEMGQAFERCIRELTTIEPDQRASLDEIYKELLAFREEHGHRIVIS